MGKTERIIDVSPLEILRDQLILEIQDLQKLKILPENYQELKILFEKLQTDRQNLEIEIRELSAQKIAYADAQAQPIIEGLTTRIHTLKSEIQNLSEDKTLIQYDIERLNETKASFEQKNKQAEISMEQFVNSELEKLQVEKSKIQEAQDQLQEAKDRDLQTKAELKKDYDKLLQLKAEFKKDYDDNEKWEVKLAEKEVALDKIEKKFNTTYIEERDRLYAQQNAFSTYQSEKTLELNNREAELQTEAQIQSQQAEELNKRQKDLEKLQEELKYNYKVYEQTLYLFNIKEEQLNQRIIEADARQRQKG